MPLTFHPNDKQNRSKILINFMLDPNKKAEQRVTYINTTFTLHSLNQHTFSSIGVNVMNKNNDVLIT